MDNNDNITDKGIQSLIGIKNLSLRNNHQVTNEGINYLMGIKILRIYNCPKIIKN